MCNMAGFLYFLISTWGYVLWGREKEREKKREEKRGGGISMWEKHWSIVFFYVPTKNWTLNLFDVWGQHSNLLSHLARANSVYNCFAYTGSLKLYFIYPFLSFFFLGLIITRFFLVVGIAVIYSFSSCVLF